MRPQPPADSRARACRHQTSPNYPASLSPSSGACCAQLQHGRPHPPHHRIPLHTARRRERPLPGLVEADRAATSLQDLAEHGWPTSFLADQLRTSTQTLAAIRNRKRRRLALVLDRKIQRLATLLLASDPADHGIAAHRSRRTQAAARHRAPSVAPTDEDFDDLDAQLAVLRQPQDREAEQQLVPGAVEACHR